MLCRLAQLKMFYSKYPKDLNSRIVVPKTMPLSLDFAQFLAEGNITDEDYYNSLSITEKIKALDVYRSCSSRQVPGNLRGLYFSISLFDVLTSIFF